MSQSSSPRVGPPPVPGRLRPAPKRRHPPACTGGRRASERRQRLGSVAPPGPLLAAESLGAVAAPRRQNTTLVGLEPTTFE